MSQNKNALYNLIKDATKLTKKEVMSILKRYSDVDMFQMMFENEPNILWLIAKIDQNNMKQKTENDKFKQIDQKFDQIDKRFDSFETRFEEKFETLTKTLLGAIAGVETRLSNRLDKLEKDVAELKTDVAQLKTDVSVLKSFHNI
ncbi:Baculovirus polyhedron envelope protein, PEP, C terminus [Mycoplasmopsis californica]|nr:Baculovirus polyhedron envelope protein, PEP, C terminus [Mycoplasmopsis californica]